MSRSRCSAGLSNCSSAAQISRKKHRRTTNTLPNLRSCPPKYGGNSDSLLEHFFEAMLPNLWYKLIPNSPSDTNTITFAMVQIWSFLVHLLLALGYLKSYTNSFKLSLDKFRDLESNRLNHHHIHFGSAHPYNQKLVYYFFKDTPIFDSPTIQNENEYACYKL